MKKVDELPIGNKFTIKTDRKLYNYGTSNSNNYLALFLDVSVLLQPS